MSGKGGTDGTANLAAIMAAIPHRYPFLMIDRVVEFVPDERIVCIKNVTINEPFFQGHFPGEPVMPGVLIAEAVAQAGGVFVYRTMALEAEGPLVYLMALDDVRFRKPVVPGDQVRISAQKLRSRGNIWKVAGLAEVDGEKVAECVVTAMIRLPRLMAIHPTAVVDPAAEIDPGAEIGPYCTVGPDVRLGAGRRLISHVAVDGRATFGEGNVVHPGAVIGLSPQSLRYKGGPTRLEIGSGNTIREHVTIHVGTEDGGGVTSVGDGCLFMVGAHVAHDCRIGNHVVLVNGVALGGHVEIEDRAQVGGLCGVHQYVRIGTHASVGGHSAVERNVLPYVLAVGNRARLRGLNMVGPRRAGFSKQDLADVRKAYGLLFSAGEEPLVRQLDALQKEFPGSERVERIVAFCRAVEESPGTARRGHCQPQDGGG